MRTHRLLVFMIQIFGLWLSSACYERTKSGTHGPCNISTWETVSVTDDQNRNHQQTMNRTSWLTSLVLISIWKTMKNQTWRLGKAKAVNGCFSSTLTSLKSATGYAPSLSSAAISRKQQKIASILKVRSPRRNKEGILTTKIRMHQAHVWLGGSWCRSCSYHGSFKWGITKHHQISKKDRSTTDSTDIKRTIVVAS